MLTILEYLVIAAVIGAAVFGLSIVVFGRGEQMAALPARTSPSELPEHGIDGDDVRTVRFGLALRGYRMSDVDWTLDRLADEIDDLRQQLASGAASAPAAQTSDQQDVFADEWAHGHSEATGSSTAVAAVGGTDDLARDFPDDIGPATS